MDKEKFDDIVQSLATSEDRRSVIKKLAGGALGGLVAFNAFGSEADAGKRRRRRRNNRGDTTAPPTTAAPTTPVPTTAPPLTCDPDRTCDPKRKDSCGDPYTCKCTKIFDDDGNPKHYTHLCRPVETCRVTYASCKVGAPEGSNEDCCLETDYCKPLYPYGDRGFCKPRQSCPPPTKCHYDGQSCGYEDDKENGCICHSHGYGDKKYWSCDFNDGFKGRNSN